MGASVSEAEVGGVLVPDEGFDASVVVAEVSPIVPSICSPFTKKPYKPPRLMPLVRIWSSVLCAENQPKGLVCRSPRWAAVRRIHLDPCR